MSAITNIRVTDFGWDGRGVGRLEEGRVVFLRGAAPGDTVAANIDDTPSKKTLAGTVVEIIEPSPHRVEHPCPHYAEGCPACPLGIYEYAEALKWKEKHLGETLVRIGGIQNPAIDAIIPSTELWGYRERIELQFSEREGLISGYRDTETGRVIPLRDCLLGLDSVRESLRLLSDKLKTDTELKLTDESVIKLLKGTRVLFRDNGEGEVVVLIFVSSDDENIFTYLNKSFEGLNLMGFQVRQVKSVDSRMFGSKMLYQKGDCRIYHRLDDDNTIITAPAVFSQVNRTLGKRLVEEVIESLPERVKIADVYGGYGVFGINYALKKAGKADIFESSGAAISAGQRFADLKGIPVKFISKDMSQTYHKEIKWSDYKAIILDPPRKGADKILLKNLNDSGSRNIIYISCHPAALARDLMRLDKYEPVKFIPFDMFPQTPDLEIIAILERQ